MAGRREKMLGREPTVKQTRTSISIQDSITMRNALWSLIVVCGLVAAAPQAYAGDWAFGFNPATEGLVSNF